MGVAGLIFDGLLALALAWLAWQSTRAVDLFHAVVSFIVFGLLMALAWVRLEAPDIALAEAAIGAGATGALLLSALDRLATHDARRRLLYEPATAWGFWIPAGGALLGGLTLAAWKLPAPGLGHEVLAALKGSGVDHPVTAVLLNFRALDTLLEIGVLLLAAVTIWSLGRAPSPVAAMPSPALPALGRLLFPVFVLVAAYLLWRGSHAPGGAFPAGAVLGAGAILMRLAGARSWIRSSERGPWRWILSLGLAMMLAAAVTGPLSGQAFFEYPPGTAGPMILLLEVAAGLSIALLLFALYLRGEPRDDGPWPDGQRGDGQREGVR